eukprot:CAMPEP_0177446986 /NCGR_PEP_ID=MMETSP0369-20130122/7382_1 /TAXON_ID=447022 ORGANISM="Scrippsiella hangoei-like, Strain SHHI-4" /NCGR_SAMPLE_ID=MMETSP0369 /ASSEMBLY_ACC=CAM_ASM_000364 /LENGTH=85 /DNA_ID=CAMNT_0018919259 /DNA_START=136 /DNA_END=393 /DNA_ORIENTATION=-
MAVTGPAMGMLQRFALDSMSHKETCPLLSPQATAHNSGTHAMQVIGLSQPNSNRLEPESASKTAMRPVCSLKLLSPTKIVCISGA